MVPIKHRWVRLPPAGRPAPAVALHPHGEKVSLGNEAFYLACYSLLTCCIGPLGTFQPRLNSVLHQKKRKGKMACKIIGFTAGETEAWAILEGQLRLMKCSTDQPDCCIAAPFPSPLPAPPTFSLDQLQTQLAQRVRSVGAARPPLLLRDLSFALSPAGKSIPDMQLSSQLTLAGSDPRKGHLSSPAALSAASEVTLAARGS